jgi:hypothetical protein
VQQLLDSGGAQTQVAGGPANNAGGQGGERQILVAHEDAGGIEVESGQKRAAKQGKRTVGPTEKVNVFEYERGRPRHHLGQFGREPTEQRRPAHDWSWLAPYQFKGRQAETGVLMLDGGKDR